MGAAYVLVTSILRPGNRGRRLPPPRELVTVE